MTEWATVKLTRAVTQLYGDCSTLTAYKYTPKAQNAEIAADHTQRTMCAAQSTKTLFHGPSERKQENLPITARSSKFRLRISTTERVDVRNDVPVSAI